MGAYDRSVILRCTKRLLAVTDPKLVAEQTPGPDAEDWYANLLWFDRRKCLLMTRSATLFTIFEPSVSASGLRATDRLVTSLIERELRSEGLPSRTFAGPEPGKVILARTADRSVLGMHERHGLPLRDRDRRLGRPRAYRYRRTQPVAALQHQQCPRLPAPNRAGHRAPRHRLRQTSAATTTAASISRLTRRAWVAAARGEQADGMA